jgi:uncharacterized surface protein with fasciclin (FAS1) repeats
MMFDQDAEVQGGDDSTMEDTETSEMMAEETTEEEMASGEFGAACSAVPADGEGSFTGILTYHVVGEQLASEDLAGEHATLQGDTITGSGEEFTVNDTAGVVCGNVQAANATVYLIDSVLMPA